MFATRQKLCKNCSTANSPIFFEFAFYHFGFPVQYIFPKMICKFETKHCNDAGQDRVSTLPVVFSHSFSHDSKMSQREPRVISTQFPCCHILPNAQSINHCYKAKYKSGKCAFQCLCAWCKQSNRKMAKTSLAICRIAAPSKLEGNGSFSCRAVAICPFKRSIAKKRKQIQRIWTCSHSFKVTSQITVSK